MTWMGSVKVRGRLARSGVIITLVLTCGLATAPLTTAAVRPGQSSEHHQIRLRSPAFASCNWLGQVILVGFNYAPVGTKRAAGQVVSIASNTPLYSLVGNTFGGSVSKGTFGLPNLSGKAPPGLHYVICTSGAFPIANGAAARPHRAVSAPPAPAPRRAVTAQDGGSCNYQGQVVLVSFDFSFDGTVAAHGELLSNTAYPTLFARLGYTFGGSPASQMFGVPNLSGQAPGGLHYRICTSGPYPSSGSPSSKWCNWLGQIVLNSFDVTLNGTLPARGQLLPLQDNEALFSLFGNTFGGSESMNTFGVPNLSGKAPPGLHYQACALGPYPARD
jgi:microcystin-dependent protein